MLNSSMNSRARFSFAAPTTLSLPSSQTSIAGSTIIAWASFSNVANASDRSVSFCASMSGADFTFCTLVAKWPCQNQVIRSVRPWSATTI